MTAGFRAVGTGSSAVEVLVVATVVLLAASMAHRMIKRSPAARHAVVLIALLTVGLCPLMVTIVRPTRVARLTSSLRNPIKFDVLLSRSKSAAPSFQNGGHVLFLSSRKIPLG